MIYCPQVTFNPKIACPYTLKQLPLYLPGPLNIQMSIKIRSTGQI